MKIFRVGGSVRDALLGLPVKDLDYVVVGTTPEQMLAAGFTPVGKDFPVFIHPTTHAEYALARTERKSAPGYHGFVFHTAPDVTIEQDLQRRDLTINAMAIDETDQSHQIIDPFGGQQDLSNRVLRHVSNAFSEDPVRILRVARFAARLNTFSIAPETLQLMRAMVESGEVNALVPERVWQEIARGLMEQQPSRMLEVLRETGALKPIMPELDTILNVDEAHTKQAVDHTAQHGLPLAVRWAVMFLNCENDQLLTQLNERLKLPTDIRDVALLALREQQKIRSVLSLSPEEVVHLLERCDAFRRPKRFTQIMQAAVDSTQATQPTQPFLEQALHCALGVPSGSIADSTKLRFPNQPQQIALAISAARAAAIAKMGKTSH